MEENKQNSKKSNNGCLIIIIITAVIAILYNIFDSSEFVADLGKYIIIIIGFALVYFAVKAINNSTEKGSSDNSIKDKENKKSSKIGCIALIILGLVMLAGIAAIANDFDSAYYAGAIFVVLLVIIGGIVLYSKMKDE